MAEQIPSSNSTLRQKLPPYTYVPALTPHPISDPRGHRQAAESSPSDPVAALWRGRELFENGFYWEAHEVWEQTWKMLGRNGAAADFVKGLIKLAAAGVKCLEGNQVGAARHAHRAAELFQQVEPELIAAGASALPFRECALRIAAGPPPVDEAGRKAVQRGGHPLLGLLPPFSSGLFSAIFP